MLCEIESEKSQAIFSLVYRMPICISSSVSRLHCLLMLYEVARLVFEKKMDFTFSLRELTNDKRSDDKAESIANHKLFSINQFSAFWNNIKYCFSALWGSTALWYDDIKQLIQRHQCFGRFAICIHNIICAQVSLKYLPTVIRSDRISLHGLIIYQLSRRSPINRKIQGCCLIPFWFEDKRKWCKIFMHKKQLEDCDWIELESDA